MRYRKRQVQLAGFEQDGKMVMRQNTHPQIDLRFMPEADGITFKLKTKFYDTEPIGRPQIKTWTIMDTGQPIGHISTDRIVINVITGPVIRLNDSIFQVYPKLGYWPSAHSDELWFAAEAKGDKVYKPALVIRKGHPGISVLKQ